MQRKHIRASCVTIASAVVLAVVAFGLLTPSAVLAEDVGTAFSYQGNLELLGSPVTETCRFFFSLWNNETDTDPGAQVGSALGQSIEVTDGVFKTELDFGGGTFIGQALWLEIAVCCPPVDCSPGLENYTRLEPRQELTPVPYALALPGLHTEQNATSPNIIGGFIGNSVTSGVMGATIGGGGAIALENQVFDTGGTVGGGRNNKAGNDDGDSTTATFATVSGGEINTASGYQATVGGGFANTASGNTSTVGGGESNTASAQHATVAGGFLNFAGDTGATVGGGGFNSASGGASTIGGGVFNRATGDSSTVGGGDTNHASGFRSTISGGWQNTASERYATVPGGRRNAAGGAYSFAAGRRARIRDAAVAGEDPETCADTCGDEGSFVWADASDFDFPSATEANITPGPNQFLARTTGGVVFVSAINGATGVSTAGVELAPGGGSWSSLSSRDAKANVDQVDGREILERLRHLPIATWNYKAQDESIRHIGPMAQDFSDAFGVGEKKTMITTIDADGVALAAIQGLHEMVKEKDVQLAEHGTELETLRSENIELRARLARLEALVQALANTQSGGGR